MHISATRYLEQEALYFSKVTGDNEKMIKNGGKTEMVSNSEKESKKRLYIKREGTRGLYFL